MDMSNPPGLSLAHSYLLCFELQISVALVVALASLSPLPVAGALLALEGAWAGILVPLRHKHLSKGGGSKGGDIDTDGDGAAWLRNGLAALVSLPDPFGAEADLVRDGGRWFEGHWSGEQASELGHRNVADFLSYSCGS